eukprot:TRINITY_DN27699_c0_g1_i3.p1 TRINITY_DN27699_c0_g1~~TRINITY_DN27699_c0_g1_i3.p1  ORF type:complete len:286 (-),score=21.97 TRINITY_DN27699_c0_g1_i3:292-1125(-)
MKTYIKNMLKAILVLVVLQGCWSQRQLLQMQSGTCSIEPNSNAQGIVLETTSAIDEGECCDKCLAKEGCNTFVYCPTKKGCTNQGRPDEVMPYQFCDLKTQADVEDPTYWFRGFMTDFSSGFVTKESMEVATTLDLSGQVARSMIIQERAMVESQEDMCFLTPNANAQGELVDNKLRIGLNSAECCDLCRQHPACNVFVYCVREEGCRNQGVPGQTFEHTRCDLKFQETVADGSSPLYWFTGPDTDFQSGYILGKQKGAPIIDPIPVPSPAPISIGP